MVTACENSAEKGGRSTPALGIYMPRQPERTLLYQLIKQHFDHLDQAVEGSGWCVPVRVRKEFEDYLKCGRLEEGFVRLSCTSCRHDALVAFSCKGRGFCPSCGARRMSQTAANLIDHVLPRQPYRQWVLSLPYPLRFLAAREPDVLSVLLQITQRKIQKFLIKTSALSSPAAKTGGVAMIQLFGSALNLNPHFHILMLDGCYCRDDSGGLTFKQNKPPTQSQINQLCIEIGQASAKKLERLGYLVSEPDTGHFLPDQEVDLLGDLQSHSITYRIAVGAKRGQKVFQLQLLSPSDEPAFGSTDPCARYAGFNLHAGLKIGAKRRDKLERLCRYMSRPPLAHARLSLTEEDKVCYRLKTPFRNGTTHVIFEPADFIAKLAALVPLPGVNLTRYFGVFAPASKVRREIVPKAVGRTRSCSGADDAVAKLVEEGGSAGCRRSDYIPWAKLLKRVFKIEVEKCALCGARVKVVAVINEHKLIEKILAHLERVGRQVRLRLSYDDIVAQYRGPPELAV